jgi:hypothetical protein
MRWRFNEKIQWNLEEFGGVDELSLWGRLADSIRAISGKI